MVLTLPILANFHMFEGLGITSYGKEKTRLEQELSNSPMLTTAQPKSTGGHPPFTPPLLTPSSPPWNSIPMVRELRTIVLSVLESVVGTSYLCTCQVIQMAILSPGCQKLERLSRGLGITHPMGGGTNWHTWEWTMLNELIHGKKTQTQRSCGEGQKTLTGLAK